MLKEESIPKEDNGYFKKKQKTKKNHKTKTIENGKKRYTHTERKLVVVKKKRKEENCAARLPHLISIK